MKPTTPLSRHQNSRMKPAPPLSAKNAPKAAISRRRRCQQFQSDARKHQHRRQRFQSDARKHQHRRQRFQSDARKHQRRRQRFQSGARWWRQSCRKYEGRLTGLDSQRSETLAWPQSKASPGYTAKLMQLRSQAPVTAVLAAVAAVLAPVTAVLAPVTAVLAAVAAVQAPVTAVLAAVAAVLAPVTAVLAPMAGPGLASRSTAPSRRLACGDLAGGPPPTAHTAAAQPAADATRNITRHLEHRWGTKYSRTRDRAASTNTSGKRTVEPNHRRKETEAGRNYSPARRSTSCMMRPHTALTHATAATPRTRERQGLTCRKSSKP